MNHHHHIIIVVTNIKKIIMQLQVGRRPAQESATLATPRCGTASDEQQPLHNTEYTEDSSEY
jgi:hypothetical protein